MGAIDYDGYVARVEFDATLERLVGRVVNAQAPIEFDAETAGEVMTRFREVVDAYVADCRDRGVDPEKPYSGRILLRIDPELHGEVAAGAAAAELSTNRFIERALRAAVGS